jgi:hypothetical protein
MNRLEASKINQLMLMWPRNALVTSKWLKEHGYYKQLVKQYCDRGWLKSLGKGAYARLNDEVIWTSAINAIQTQLNLPLHVGGLTALQIHGVSQYAVLQDQDPIFYLYETTTKKSRLPTWFSRYFKNVHFEKKKLFVSASGVSEKNVNQSLLNVSVPERAILEILVLVPNKINLSHANALIENLDRLRVDVMQAMLEACLSIKTKRLFLYLAEKNNLACFTKLNIKKIDLGVGKRMVGKGGHYHKRWQISVEHDDFDDTEDLSE